MAFSSAKAAQIAQTLNCEPASVLAVADVESGGRKDLPDGRPQILFEAHWFGKLTGYRYNMAHPRISSYEWNRSLYVGGAGEYDRLAEAMRLDVNAALQSASWGLFQIMGFNYRACGFATVQEFVDAIKGDDDADMVAFINFVRANGQMLQALRTKDWRTFARLYNGPGAVASYSAKLADAYARHAGKFAFDLEGPPIPVAAPDMQPATLATSKTAWGLGVTAGGSALSFVDQISQVTSGAASISYSLGSIIRTFGPIAIAALVAGIGVYLFIRYRNKMLNGDVVIR